MQCESSKLLRLIRRLRRCVLCAKAPAVCAAKVFLAGQANGDRKNLAVEHGWPPLLQARTSI
jgi:hypothetical protein